MLINLSYDHNNYKYISSFRVKKVSLSLFTLLAWKQLPGCSEDSKTAVGMLVVGKCCCSTVEASDAPDLS